MQATVSRMPRHADGAIRHRSRVLAVDELTADFDDFYRREFPSMVALAHTICGDGQLAEDLAQEALSRAHGQWAKIAAYDKPGAWLRRVTINLALSRRRRLAREVIGLGRQRPDPVDPISETGEGGEIWEAVAKLAPKQRAAIALFYQEDLSTSEIAEILDCKVSTATSHLSQARKRLAYLLDEDPPGEVGPSPQTNAGTPNTHRTTNDGGEYTHGA